MNWFEAYDLDLPPFPSFRDFCALSVVVLFGLAAWDIDTTARYLDLLGELV